MISRFPLFKENFKNQNEQNVIQNMYKDRYIISISMKDVTLLTDKKFRK